MSQRWNKTDLSSVLENIATHQHLPFNYLWYSSPAASRNGEASDCLVDWHFWGYSNQLTMLSTPTQSQHFTICKGYNILIPYFQSWAQKDVCHSTQPYCWSASSRWPWLITHCQSSAHSHRLHISCSVYSKSYTSHMLSLMQESLSQFYDNKTIFLNIGVQNQFILPKLHSLSHYASSIQLFKTTDNYNIEQSEHLLLQADFSYRAAVIPW